MRKLYRSAVHQNFWIAFTEDQGWVAFPDKENGWEMRRPARGIDPLYLREAPANMAANTGFPQISAGTQVGRVA